MKITTILTFLVLLILTSIITPAYAYLDSGTGSMIIQMLFAGAAGLLAILKLYWEKVKNLWKRFWGLFKIKKTKFLPPSDDKTNHDKTR